MGLKTKIAVGFGLVGISYLAGTLVTNYINVNGSNTQTRQSIGIALRSLNESVDNARTNPSPFTYCMAAAQLNSTHRLMSGLSPNLSVADYDLFADFRSSLDSLVSVGYHVSTNQHSDRLTMTNFPGSLIDMGRSSGLVFSNVIHDGSFLKKYNPFLK